MLRTIMTMFLLLTALVSGVAQAETAAEPDVVRAAGPDYWRVIRQGDSGITQAQGSNPEANNLINVSGEYWRQLRNQWITPVGAIVLLGVIGILVLFYLIMGRIPLSKPRTGVKITRWSKFERSVHWTVAVLFIMLGLSGISLLFGKFFLKPIMSDAVWGGYLNFIKVIHNYLGPIFFIALLFMVIMFMSRNFFSMVDVKWFMQGGGILDRKVHPSAGFSNGGEKVWYWAVFFLGLTVCISGVILDFPNFGQFRDTMQWSNLIHAGASVLLMAGALGHIYIGTLGMEGALEGMVSGEVDETWAKEHHDLWYEEVKNKG